LGSVESFFLKDADSLSFGEGWGEVKKGMRACIPL